MTPAPPPAGLLDRWSWRLTLGALLLFVVGLVARPDGDAWATLFDGAVYNLVVGAAGLTAWCAARRTSRDRTAWYGLAAYGALNVAGNLAWSVLHAVSAPAPVPSLADVLYLASYPALYLAVVCLIRARVRQFHPGTWLDAAIGALSASAVAFGLLLAPQLHLVDGDLVIALTLLAYPVVDVVLLALLVAAAAVLGIRRDPVLALVGLGLAGNLVGDVVYLDQTAADRYTAGGPLDLTWLLASVALAAAARHGGLVRTGGDGRGDRLGWRMLLVPVSCNLAALALLAAGWGDDYPVTAAWCAVGCVLAGLVRTVVAVREARDFSLVRRQALTDDLTGLGNRRAFLDGAEQVVRDASARHPAALLLLDLDGFKEVNDGLGHGAGDELLVVVADRLTAELRDGDLLARLGGDEFAVLMPGTDPTTAAATAARVRERLTQVVTVSGTRLHVGVSIGVATCPYPAGTVTELLRCADVAMYRAKPARAGVRVHAGGPAAASPGGSALALRTMDELRTALTGDQVDVHLQPQVSLLDRRVVGVEALVRWHHPARGLVLPGELLPLAERAGLLPALADRVLDRGLAAAALWWCRHPVPVSVNLHADDVVDPGLPARVAAALHRHGLPPAALAVELVEDTLLRDAEGARAVLDELRTLGVRVSIDDYGTGYSSLTYLGTLPADELKLDRSLVAHVVTAPTARAIVRHTTALAHDLGLVLVAEGVEDEETLHQLVELGCDAVQGWVVARPMPVTDLLPWLDGAALVSS